VKVQVRFGLLEQLRPDGDFVGYLTEIAKTSKKCIVTRREYVAQSGTVYLPPFADEKINPRMTTISSQM